jgi:NUDIX domain
MDGLRSHFAEHAILEGNGKNVRIFPLLPPNIEKSLGRRTTRKPQRRELEDPAAETSTTGSQRRPQRQQHERGGAGAGAGASVLVPLVSYGGEVSLLYTVRAGHLSSHASEVAFPGGHFDEKLDETLVDTALREAQEELVMMTPPQPRGGETHGERGDDYNKSNDHSNIYPWDEVTILGTTTPLPSITGTPVTAVIGIFPYEIDQTTFPGSPDEVDDVFCVSLRELLNVESSERSERFRTHVPVFPVSANKDGSNNANANANSRRIWGLTAAITRPLLHKLFQPVFLPDWKKDGS